MTHSRAAFFVHDRGEKVDMEQRIKLHVAARMERTWKHMEKVLKRTPM